VSALRLAIPKAGRASEKGEPCPPVVSCQSFVGRSRRESAESNRTDLDLIERVDQAVMTDTVKMKDRA
jgi:hypothetical protein